MEGSMKPAEKIKTQKLVKKIETGQFDENDIDSLFMKLRAYSAGFLVIREVADFVAHNDLRDRGLTNKSLETMYLRIKFFLEYDSPKTPLDLSSPFPIWIKKLMILQADKCNEEDLRKKFNVTSQRLINRIDKAFKEDKKNKIAVYQQDQLSQATFNAIQYVMSFISGNPTFNQDDLLNELISVLKKNQIDFDEPGLRALSNRITICTLLLFHHSVFDFNGKKKGQCEISSENGSISHNVRFVDVAGNQVEHHETFGNLHVKGTVNVEKDGEELSISHTIMSTNLASQDWCSDELFKIEPMSKETPNYMCKRLMLDTNLCINTNFQLSAIHT